MPFIVGIWWKANSSFQELNQSFKIIYLQWDDIWSQTVVYALCRMVFALKVNDKEKNNNTAPNLGRKQDLLEKYEFEKHE